MMSDEDDDIWYSKAQNGLIQTKQDDKSLDDSYLEESKNALSVALGPRWTSKAVEENA